MTKEFLSDSIDYVLKSDSLSAHLSSLDSLNYENIIDGYTSFLGVDSLVSYDFVNSLIDNYSYFNDSTNHSLIYEAFIILSCDQNVVQVINSDYLHSRAIFTLIANILGADCTGQIVAGMLESVLAVSLAIAFPPAIPALTYFTWASVTATYGNAMIETVKCAKGGF